MTLSVCKLRMRFFERGVKREDCCGWEPNMVKCGRLGLALLGAFDANRWRDAGRGTVPERLKSA